MASLPPGREYLRLTRGLRSAVFALSVIIVLIATSPGRVSATGTATTTAPASDASAGLIQVQGIVLDPAGKPLAGAKVTATANWEAEDPAVPGGAVAQVTSGSDGRFDLTFRRLPMPAVVRGGLGADVWRRVMIVASAEGFGIAWQRCERADASGDLVLKLIDDQPVEGRVLDQLGNPVPGVRVTAGSLVAAVAMAGEDNARFARELAEGGLYRPLAAAGLLDVATTDAQGRFRITGLGRERSARLEFRSDRVVVPSARLVTRAMPPVVREDDGIRTTTYGAKFDLSGLTARSIVGTVRDAKTHAPLARVLVESRPFRASAMTDDQGRYRLDGLRKWGRNRLTVTPSEDQPYFATERTGIPDEPGIGPMTVDIELHRGIWVTGRVTNQATGKPVVANVLYSPYLSNPHAAGIPDYVEMRNHVPTHPPQGAGVTREDGTYRVVGLPGRGVVAAESLFEPYLKGIGAEEIVERGRLAALNHFRVYADMGAESVDAVKEVDAPDDATQASADLQLDPGEAIEVTVEDPQGNPVRGFDAFGANSRLNPPTRIDQVSFMAAGFAISERRAVVLFDGERQIGKAFVLRLADVPLSSMGGDAVRRRRLKVRLEPMAVITGRLVGANGQPMKSARVDAGTAIPALPPGGNFSFVGSAVGDSDGRFTLALAPGCDYVVQGTHESSQQGAPATFTILSRLTAQPGVNRDLGEVRLKPSGVVELKPPSAGAVAVAAADAAKTGTPTTQPQAADVIQVRGRVLDPSGNPRPAARVTAVLNASSDPDEAAIPRGPLAQVTTGADGRFDLSVRRPNLPAMLPNGRSAGDIWKAVTIVASADGHGLAWDRVDPTEPAGDVVLKLVDDLPIEGTIIDPEGRPVAGIMVIPESLGAIGDVAAPMRDPAGNLRGASENTLSHPLSATGRLDGVVTDARGRFRIPGLGRERSAALTFQSLKLSVDAIEVMTRDVPTTTQNRSTFPGGPDATVTTYGAKFDLVGTPTRAITGTVRDAKTRKPLVGVKVEDPGFRTSVVTDDHGCYRLGGVQKREGNRLIVTPPDDQPFFTAERTEIPDALGLGPMTVDIDLHRGTWITGKVTDKATGKPLAGAKVQYAPFLTNTEAAAIPEYQRIRNQNLAEAPLGLGKTRHDGTFRVVGLPGRGVVAATSRGDPYLKGIGADLIKARGIRGDRNGFDVFLVMSPTNVDSVKPVDISPGSTGESVDLQLDPGDTVRIAVEDPQGRPVSGFQSYGMRQYTRTDGPTLTVAALAPGESRTIILVDERQKLARTIVVRAAVLPDHRMTARLEPMALLTGRLLAAQGGGGRGGTPLRGARLIVNTVFYLEGETSVGSATADDDGRFKLYLVPNLDCRVSASQQTPANANAAGGADERVTDRIRLEAGAVRDLGEVRLKARE